MVDVGGADAAPRPLADAWITQDLLVRTRQVWGDHGGEPVSEADALEILQTVRRMAVLAMRSLRDEDDAVAISPPPPP